MFGFFEAPDQGLFLRVALSIPWDAVRRSVGADVVNFLAQSTNERACRGHPPKRASSNLPGGINENPQRPTSQIFSTILLPIVTVLTVDCRTVDVMRTVDTPLPFRINILLNLEWSVIRYTQSTSGASYRAVIKGRFPEKFGQARFLNSFRQRHCTIGTCDVITVFGHIELSHSVSSTFSVFGR